MDDERIISEEGATLRKWVQRYGLKDGKQSKVQHSGYRNNLEYLRFAMINHHSGFQMVRSWFRMII